ncbi:MAG: hypothetical protein GWN00_23155 [Aliifodinibius sp.]|nr:hypothetical protein [candidate division Zixibacteria bacterium]NIT59014.1 hypothetical protein [Fodinibius sp.]NIW46650.1 hypothetical protein [Gammaproteobacteria bacterium]NIS47259.1 hypothetical protein [candidate division Zixibacteria bacterium]NIU15393.1 hypothetical protein [candidate division Zixibacteria bacterium]
MSDVIYISKIRIERKRGPLRYAYLPTEDEPVPFGVHSEIAAHYGAKMDVNESHAATLDYVVAATGG